MSKAIIIDYYTDVLCVWAWIAQPRLEELQQQWQDKVEVRHRYLDIFGDAHRKIPARWGADDGFDQFGNHVCEAVAGYPEIDINSRIWRHHPPTTSLSAHLYIKAAQICSDADAANAYALAIRRAFFLDAQDISATGLLLDLAGQCHIPLDRLEASVANGTAMAELSADLRDAATQHVHGSPTWVLNEGRQVLFGNVGYRILHANIEELLRREIDGASWC